MKTMQLGDSDLEVSRICFGCWQLSPKFWGEVALEPWEEALKKALDIGVNFIDTANAYGEGYAESSLGEFFSKTGLRDEFILATKFYWNFEEEPRYPDTRYDSIMKECEASLKRLQTDRIDLYQIHATDPLTRPDEVAKALLKLQEEGKVRWFGVSNQNPEVMRMYQKHFRVSSLQPVYNMLQRDIEKHEFPYCIAENIGVMVYSPLARGLLSGKYAADHVFDDPRNNDPRFSGDAFKRIVEGTDELRPFADKYNLTIAQLAIRWVLTHPVVTCAIVGIKTVEHIETIAPAAADVLPPDDWHKMAKIMDAASAEALALT